MLLKLASPGVPDIYQGCETLDFSLVDPDNRKPVDFARLRAELARIEEAAASSRLELVKDLMRTAADGRIKLYLTSRGLGLPPLRGRLFESVLIIRWKPRGGRNQHVVAFARRQGDKLAIAAAGRFFYRLSGGRAPHRKRGMGRDGADPARAAQAPQFEDVLTGRAIRARQRGEVWTLPLAEVFGELPVCLLQATTEA